MIRLVTTGIRHTAIFRFSLEFISYCGVFKHPRVETDTPIDQRHVISSYNHVLYEIWNILDTLKIYKLLRCQEHCSVFM